MGRVIWGQQNGDGSMRRSDHAGALGWEYCDGIMGMRARGQECGNESMQTVEWGVECGDADSTFVTFRGRLGPFFPMMLNFSLPFIYLFLPASLKKSK